MTCESFIVAIFILIYPRRGEMAPFRVSVVTNYTHHFSGCTCQILDEQSWSSVCNLSKIVTFEAETKRLPFCRRHFQMHFFWMKIFVFSFKFNWSLFAINRKPALVDVYDLSSNYHGSLPNKRQAIIWTNGGLVYWRIYASLDFNELSQKLKFLLRILQI